MYTYIFRAKVTEIKRELSLRTRALSSCSSGIRFPDPKVMKEFLENPPEKIDLEALKTPTPSLIQFVVCCPRHNFYLRNK